MQVQYNKLRDNNNYYRRPFKNIERRDIEYRLNPDKYFL